MADGMINQFLVGIMLSLVLGSGDAQVTIDLTHELSIGGVHQLRRERYFNTHNAPRWGAIPKACTRFWKRNGARRPGVRCGI